MKDTFMVRTARRLLVAAPEPLYGLVGRMRRSTRRLLRRAPRVQRVRGAGATTGRRVSVLVAGTASTVDYLLKGILADAAPDPATAHSGRDQNRSAADQVPSTEIVMIPCSALPRNANVRDYWRVPDAVGFTVDLRRGDGKIASKSCKRRIRKFDLRPRLTHDIREFHRFVEEAYLPYIRARFGELARPHSRIHLQRCFRRGGILWAERHGVPRAGMLFTISGGTATIHVSAPLHDQPDAARIGALTAARKFLFDIAIAEGCMTVDMGSARPNLLDGVLQHKKAWGARISGEGTPGSDICLRWSAFTRDIAGWLNTMPLVIREHGGLSALTAIPDDASTEEVRCHLEKLAVPGLERIFVLGPPRSDTPAAVRDISVCWEQPDRPESVSAQLPRGYDRDR